MGGNLIQDGRAKAFVRYNIASIVACLLMQVKWMPALVIGKFLHGVTVTVVLIAGNKMIVETIPKDQCGNFAPISPFFNGLGYVLVLGGGLFLPQEEYYPGKPLEGANLEAH